MRLEFALHRSIGCIFCLRPSGGQELSPGSTQFMQIWVQVGVAPTGVSEGNGTDQGAHLFGTTRTDMSHCQGHHASQCQTHAGLHPGLTAEIVKLETKAVIQTAIDPLQCVASLITAFPGRAAMGSGSKNPWGGRVQINSYDMPIVSGLANSLLVVSLPTLAPHPGSRAGQRYFSVLRSPSKPWDVMGRSSHVSGHRQ